MPPVCRAFPILAGPSCLFPSITRKRLSLHRLGGFDCQLLQFSPNSACYMNATWRRDVRTGFYDIFIIAVKLRNQLRPIVDAQEAGMAFACGGATAEASEATAAALAPVRDLRQPESTSLSQCAVRLSSLTAFVKTPDTKKPQDKGHDSRLPKRLGEEQLSLDRVGWLTCQTKLAAWVFLLFESSRFKRE